MAPAAIVMGEVKAEPSHWEVRPFLFAIPKKNKTSVAIHIGRVVRRQFPSGHRSEFLKTRETRQSAWQKVTLGFDCAGQLTALLNCVHFGARELRVQEIDGDDGR